MIDFIKPIFVSCLCCLVIFSCQQAEFIESDFEDPEYLHRSMKNLSDIIVYDIFSPPVASRNYVYPSIAAYEVMASFNQNYQSLSGQIHELTAAPAPTSDIISPTISAVTAFNKTARHFIFSEDKMTLFEETLNSDMRKKGVPRKVWEASVAYGEAVAQHIIEWSNGDMYKQTRTYPKFSINRDPARWKPTPPGYFDGIEPHWREIRTFVIDSADQFVPAPPTSFDMKDGSQFFKETMEVYDVVKTADEEKREIASFWDCNPFVLNVTGHVMHASKKITPGGHWIGIAALACRKADADLSKSIETYALTSIALADAFISCWDEKYRSNLVRPETVINEYIDENWVPVLQTPPFPEHTSGHSVISRAAAVALTSIYGDDFAFDDTVELEYGLPVRKFKSFFHASEEAAISRLYGGIHYRPAIDYGVEQGEKIGKFIVENIEMKS